MIAHDEGYDIKHGKGYYFDLLASRDGSPILKGYVTMGFYINGNIRSSISINEETGQTIDMNTCEVFDYPDLKPFQAEIRALSRKRAKTPQELADDAGCGAQPKVLSSPGR